MLFSFFRLYQIVSSSSNVHKLMFTKRYLLCVRTILKNFYSTVPLSKIKCHAINFVWCGVQFIVFGFLFFCSFFFLSFYSVCWHSLTHFQYSKNYSRLHYLCVVDSRNAMQNQMKCEEWILIFWYMFYFFSSIWKLKCFYYIIIPWFDYFLFV